MMKEEQLNKRRELIDQIKEALDTLENEFNTSFIISISTTINDKERISDTGCSCNMIEAVALFHDLVEDKDSLIKPMSIVTSYYDKISQIDPQKQVQQ